MAMQRKLTSARTQGGRAKAAPLKWSKQVMQQSDALDLKTGVFTLKSPRSIANSLKRSSVASKRRKSSPFRSAMSMLNFEINRAGKGLTAERLRVLTRAKVELRKAFGRDTTTPNSKTKGAAARR